MRKDKIINIICPVSDKKMNENAARIAAGITVIITLTSLYFHFSILMALLAADFAIRAYTREGKSPVKYITKSIISAFQIKNKPIDAAQKKFAAELGFILSTAIFLLQIFGNHFVATILGFMLIFFALLESVFNFCVGCIIYTYFALPLLRKNNP